MLKPIVGNDIISLSQLIDYPNQRKAKYLNKIASQEEQKLIGNISPFALWSIKESSFKAHQQLDSSLTFQPKQHHVITAETLSSCITGKVQFNNALLWFNIQLQNEYLHCFSTQIENNSKIISGEFTNDNDFTTNAVTAISEKLKKPISAIKIVKQKQNIPVLLVHNQTMPLSLSHDYNFGAFALIKNE